MAEPVDPAVMEILVDRIPTMNERELARFGTYILQHAVTHISQSDWDLDIKAKACLLAVRLATQHVPVNLISDELAETLCQVSGVINDSIPN